jgi:hypothetical protein
MSTKPSTPARPSLILDKATPRPVTFVVYAPLGDPLLSRYPNGQTATLREHPLFTSLSEVAKHGINVVALVDLVDEPTWLVEIPAHGEPIVGSKGKQDMASPIALRELLSYCFCKHKDEAFVFSLEGHGAGFLPTIDATMLTLRELPNRLGAGVSSGAVVLPDGGGGSLVIAGSGNPVLQMGGPTVPFNGLPRSASPMSTYELGEALRQALESQRPACRRLSIVHLNNCFNFSVELLHTIARSAEFAAGYSDYNFFSGGRPYVQVFEALARAGSMSAEELALQLSRANGEYLRQDPDMRQPTIGSVIALRRMDAVVTAIDVLAKALIAALPLGHKAIIDAIQVALQYDANGDLVLEVPDAFTDLRSFAKALAVSGLPARVLAAATDVHQALNDVKVYGEKGSPWMDATNNIIWDFTDNDLGMSIFLPDPKAQGDWDWRSPYYLTPQPGALASQPQVIKFLQTTAWVDFIRKLHEGVAFKALRKPLVPAVPQTNPRVEPCPPKGTY